MTDEDIEKSVDMTQCVQVLQEETRGGQRVMVKRWKRPNNVEAHHQVIGNHHLLDPNHPQYQPESEATKPQEPKRKRKPKPKANADKPVDKDKPVKNEKPAAKPKKEKQEKPKKEKSTAKSKVDSKTSTKAKTKQNASKVTEKTTPKEDKPISEKNEKIEHGNSIKDEVKNTLKQAAEKDKAAEKNKAADNDKLTESTEKDSPKASKSDHLVPLKAGEKTPEFITKAHGTIPPGWKNIKVATNPNEDLWLQAEDSQGRPQRKYNPVFSAKKQDEKWERCTAWVDEEKYSNLQQSIKGIATAVGTVQPDGKIKPFSSLERAKNVEKSDCLTLILEMGLRPSSEVDTKARTKAYGATTLQAKHVVVEKTKTRAVNVFLRFTGKDGVEHDHQVTDKKLKDMLIRRKNKAMIHKGENGQIFDINDRDLRVALEPIGLKPKDLRTICAMHNAQKMLKTMTPTTDAKEFDKIVKQVCDGVCKILGNRREQTFDSYIAPDVWKTFSPEGYKNWLNAKSKKGSGKDE